MIVRSGPEVEKAGNGKARTKGKRGGEEDWKGRRRKGKRHPCIEAKNFGERGNLVAKEEGGKEPETKD